MSHFSHSKCDISRHVHTTYPGVRVFHEDRDDIPHGAEIWRPGVLYLN